MVVKPTLFTLSFLLLEKEKKLKRLNLSAIHFALLRRQSAVIVAARDPRRSTANFSRHMKPARISKCTIRVLRFSRGAVVVGRWGSCDFIGFCSQ